MFRKTMCLCVTAGIYLFCVVFCGTAQAVESAGSDRFFTWFPAHDGLLSVEHGDTVVDRFIRPLKLLESEGGGRHIMVAAGITTGKEWKGKKGSSLDNPIVIKKAPTHTMGVRMEYAIVGSLFGADSKVIEQDLLEEGKKKIDVLHVKLKSGEKVKIYFDITAFFGKFTK